MKFKNTALIIFVLIFIGSLSIGAAGISNPAAVYCKELGYQYKIEKTESGEQGICIIKENFIEYDEWNFFTGKVGKEYSYCVRHGYDIKTVRGGGDPFSKEYAVCVPKRTLSKFLRRPANTKTKSVTELMNLKEKVFSNEEVKNIEKGANVNSKQQKSSSSESLPSGFDWRNYNGNWLTPVKNQGLYGVCWAFSAIGTTESKINIARNNPDFDVDLSEQDVASCLSPSSDPVFDKLTNGVVDEPCFPYVAKATSCSNACSTWEKRLWKIDGYGEVPLNIDDVKRYLIEKGPLETSISVDGSFDGNGIYRCDEDNPNYKGVNHAVVTVGYNDAGGYWIVKNSWGLSWNGDGYFKVGYGECGIDDHPREYLDLELDSIKKINTNDVQIQTGSTSGSYDNFNSKDGNYVTYNEDCSGSNCNGLDIKNLFPTGSLSDVNSLDIISYQQAGSSGFYLKYLNQNNDQSEALGDIPQDFYLIKYNLCSSASECSAYLSSDASINYLHDSCSSCSQGYVNIDWLYLEAGLVDADKDLITDEKDNCPNNYNPSQEDADDDGIGDVCDNCISIYNPDQEDTDGNSKEDFLYYWKFDEGDGVIAHSEIAKDDGMLTGANWTSGKINSALSFDGLDDNVIIKDNTNFEFNQPFTISAWLFLNDNSKGGIIGKGNVNYGKTFMLSIKNSRLRVIMPNAKYISYLYGKSEIKTNEWTHVAVSYDGATSVKLYINGNLDASGNKAVDTYARGQTTIGIDAITFDERYYLNGIIDEVAVFNKALTEKEIEQTYQNSLNGLDYFGDGVGDVCDTEECYIDSDCDDNFYCNGIETCQDGVCVTTPVDVGCLQDSDCDDNNGHTADTCKSDCFCEHKYFNSPPVIFKFPGKISFRQGESYKLDMNKYVYDLDDEKSDLKWTYAVESLIKHKECIMLPNAVKIIAKPEPKAEKTKIVVEKPATNFNIFSKFNFNIKKPDTAARDSYYKQATQNPTIIKPIIENEKIIIEKPIIENKNKIINDNNQNIVQKPIIEESKTEEPKKPETNRIIEDICSEIESESNLIINIEKDNIATISAKEGFTGTEDAEFTVMDAGGLTDSKILTVEVTE